MVQSIGSDYVIDYIKEDFTKNGRHYDLILATAGYRSIFDYKRALSPDGSYIATGGSMSGPKAMAQIFEAMFLGPWASMNGNKKMGNISAKSNQEDLTFIKELLEDGKIKPVIDRCYPFSEVAEALRYYSKGHSRGKVVIEIENNNI